MLMSAALAMPSVPMVVSTCWVPSAVCATQVLNSVLMASSAIVRTVELYYVLYIFNLLLLSFLS